MKDMQGVAMQKKYVEGPIAFMTVRKNGPPTMGIALSLWFVYCLIIAATAGTIALCAHGLTANANRAGQLACAISFLACVGGSVQMGIWMGKPWGSVVKRCARWVDLRFDQCAHIHVAVALSGDIAATPFA